jgi:anti-sigma regulatory factor (Ser/Thr protein kinase)
MPGPIVIAPRRPGSPVDGEGDPVAVRRNAFAGQLDHPPEAGLRPQPGSSTEGGGPSVATTQDREPDGRRRDWRLPATESSVTVLRRGLGDFLRGAALSDDERYDLLLAAGEAASNAIEHAGDPSEPFFEVLARIGDASVTIIVCDHGRWCDGTPGTYRGRGLAMMRVLVDTTIDVGAHGTTVTLRSHRPAARAPGHAQPQHGAADESPFPSPAVGGL